MFQGSGVKVGVTRYVMSTRLYGTIKERDHKVLWFYISHLSHQKKDVSKVVNPPFSR
jgi:hypothetical protein